MTDSKTSDRDVNRAIRSWLHENRHEDVSRVAGAVLDQVDATPQRRATPWPARRTPIMNKFVAIGLGAAAVVLALFLGAQFFGAPTGGVGSQPTATPRLTASPEPTSSPPSSPPPLIPSFSSTVNGYSVSYPEGWETRAATEPWSESTFPLNFERPDVDVLYDPSLNSGGPFLAIASQPIGDSTPEDWVALQMASDEGCSAHMAVTIDGFTGQIGRNECNVAVVTAAGHGYWFQLYTGSEAPATYDHAWFEEVLATVQLHPEDATD